MPPAKPKDSTCQRMDHGQGVFKGKGKMQTPQKLCACPGKQSSAGELGAHPGHSQGSPKSPKAIMASASRDAFNCVRLDVLIALSIKRGMEQSLFCSRYSKGVLVSEKSAE